MLLCVPRGSRVARRGLALVVWNSEVTIVIAVQCPVPETLRGHGEGPAAVTDPRQDCFVAATRDEIVTHTGISQP